MSDTASLTVVFPQGSAVKVWTAAGFSGLHLQWFMQGYFWNTYIKIHITLFMGVRFAPCWDQTYICLWVWRLMQDSFHFLLKSVFWSFASSLGKKNAEHVSFYSQNPTDRKVIWWGESSHDSKMHICIFPVFCVRDKVRKDAGKMPCLKHQPKHLSLSDMFTKKWN